MRFGLGLMAPVMCGARIYRERDREKERDCAYMGVSKKETEKRRGRNRDACVSDWDSWLLSCVVPEPRDRENERKRENAQVWESGGEREREREKTRRTRF